MQLVGLSINFHPWKGFSGDKSIFIFSQKFYRTVQFWRITQISNNRYVCYRNRDAKPKLRRSNLCYYLRSIPKEMLKGIKQEVSMTNPCRFHLRNRRHRRWISWSKLKLKTAKSIGNWFPVIQTINWSSTKFYQGIGGEDCLDLGGVLSKSRPRSVVSWRTYRILNMYFHILTPCKCSLPILALLWLNIYKQRYQTLYGHLTFIDIYRSWLEVNRKS